MATETATLNTVSAAEFHSGEVIPRMTYEEFLDWAGDRRAEWVDGEVILMSPVSTRHQDYVDFLTGIIRHYVETLESGFVRSAGVQMRLSTRPSGREPDVIYVAQQNIERVHETYIDGPVDLAVEVISPESRVRDQIEKYSEYQTAGVREYWLLDPLNQKVEFYQLGDDNAYRLIPPDRHGIYHSVAIEGFWLREAWLWQMPLPRVIDVAREWKLM